MAESVFGPEYPKINTIFERDQRGIILPSYATDEIAYLADSQWNWTEKVDGTNIRLYWNGGMVTIGGRTNGDSGSQLEAGLVRYLMHNTDLTHPIAWRNAFPVDCNDVTIYGEGYGKGIRSGGQYDDRIRFIIFDVRVGEWWLSDKNIVDVANKMGVEVVPRYGSFSVNEAWELIRSGTLRSNWPNASIEGLVGRPAADLYDRKGERIVVKTKVRDYHDWLKNEERLARDAELEAKRAAKKAAFDARGLQR